MKKPLLALILISAAATPLTANAQFAKPEDAVKFRQSAYTVMGNHFGRISGVVRGTRPYNAAEVTESAAIIELMAKQPLSAFGTGTDVGTHRAKPEVWTKAGEFKSAAEKLMEETVKLSAAARSGNIDNIKAAFANTGQSCKACHDNFRKE